jgi:WXG100 family type VII secretion target
MVLRVDPDELETQAQSIEAIANEFGGDLDTARTRVDGLDWDGQTREAFVAMFEEARYQFKDVEQQIANIAATLRAAKDGLIEADESIARAVSGR